MLRIPFIFAALWAAAGFAGAALAETRVALVIGNSAYAHTTPLANPLNDARDMSAALKRTGFDVVEALDADKRKLDGALRSFADKLSAADVALFFYAGHGLQVGAQNYLVPTDAKLERERDLQFEAVSLDFVLRQMEIEREGKTTIVILDACRDNPLSRNLARSMGTRSASIGRGLAAASTGLGTFIAYATQPGNVALDGDGRNSPFTAALTRQIEAKGRNLTATMIEVRKQVVAATGGRQVPWDHSALTGDFFFVAGDAAPQAGSVSAAPQGSSEDLAALKQRLARLEEEAKARGSGAAPGAMMTADGIKLAELRARAANLDDLVKDLQKKLMRARMEEGKSVNANEKMKLQRTSMDIQREWTLRGMDLKKLKDEIAALEGKAVPPQREAAVSPPPPVTPPPDPNASAPDFSQDDNVRLEGTEIRSMRAPNPDACRNTCAEEAGCVGYQHGRKIPLMGTCTLFSKVDARHEDNSWRSGMRGAATKATLLPPELLGQKPARSEQGFKVFEGAMLEGNHIKMAPADSARACVTVCRNTAGCTAATFMAKTGEIGNMCTALSRVSKAKTGINGASALIRE